MEAVVKISDELCEDRVHGFLSTLKISALSSGRVAIPVVTGPQSGNDSSVFSIGALPGGDLFDAEKAQWHLDNLSESLFLFNSEAVDLPEPKVIYVTDLSTRAKSNLEKFRHLRPAGFSGATVLTENETIPTKITWNDISRQFLDRIRSAVQTSRANLIIANYDLANPGRKFYRIEYLTELVRQNKCHVLILKT